MTDGHVVRGIVIREDPDRLIVQASEADVAAFARQAWAGAVVSGVRNGWALQAEGDGASLRASDTLYDVNGRPVAMITEMSMTAEALDMTRLGDAYQHYARGRVRVDIRAVGI